MLTGIVCVSYDRVVKCALQQIPASTQVAQTSLAEYLALHPYSPHIWQL